MTRKHVVHPGGGTIPYKKNLQLVDKFYWRNDQQPLYYFTPFTTTETQQI